MVNSLVRCNRHMSLSGAGSGPETESWLVPAESIQESRIQETRLPQTPSPDSTRASCIRRLSLLIGAEPLDLRIIPPSKLSEK